MHSPYNDYDHADDYDADDYDPAASESSGQLIYQYFPPNVKLSTHAVIEIHLFPFL